MVLQPHDISPPWKHPPDPGEPESGLLYRLLAQRGYRAVRLDTTRSWLNPWRRSAPALRAIDPWRALRVLFAYRRAAVVIANMESSALVILLLRRLLLFRPKVVVWDVGVPGWRLRDAMLRIVVPRADLLMLLGRNQAAGLLAMGARPGRIRPVLTSVSTEFYVAAPDAPGGYILAIGDDVSRDYATLLAACDGLGRELVIRSRVVRPDPARPHVRVISGALPIAAYRQLIAEAAVVVLPLHRSLHAGGITVLLEALSSAKPVVVSDSPGLADYVVDGETCLVVPCGNVAALHRVVAGLLADASERARLGANARRVCEADYSRAAAAERLADALDEVRADSDGADAMRTRVLG